MDPSTLKTVLEAMLFAADEPLSAEVLAEASETTAQEVQDALEALKTDYDVQGRGLRVAAMAGGWIIITREDLAPYIARLLRGKKRMRLSRPALETLAIIAYKQPVTKAEVDSIRGVDSSGVLNTLLERELVTIRGRAKVLGRPLLYGTTSTFLTYFGLNDLNELPRVEELKAIVGEKEPENPEAEPELALLPLPGVEAAEDESEEAVEVDVDDEDEAIDEIGEDVPEAAYASGRADDDDEPRGDKGSEL
jgi:segregation and condensation protein B